MHPETWMMSVFKPSQGIEYEDGGQGSLVRFSSVTSMNEVERCQRSQLQPQIQTQVDAVGIPMHGHSIPNNVPLLPLSQLQVWSHYHFFHVHTIFFFNFKFIIVLNLLKYEE